MNETTIRAEYQVKELREKMDRADRKCRKYLTCDSRFMVLEVGVLFGGLAGVVIGTPIGAQVYLMVVGVIIGGVWALNAHSVRERKYQYWSNERQSISQQLDSARGELNRLRERLGQD